MNINQILNQITIFMATAYALEEKKKRDEEEAAQVAQVQAEVDAKNAAIEANRIEMMEQLKIRNWLEGQERLNQLADEEFEEQWNQDRRDSSLETMSEVIHNNTIEQAYQTYRQGEYESVVQKPSILDTAWNWLYNKQTDLSFGTGIAIGAVAAIGIVAGVITAPAWIVIGGVALLTAGVITAGTLAINNHFGLDPSTNLADNIITGVVPAVALTGVGYLLAPVVPMIGKACINNPTVCASVGPIIDVGEHALLQTQLGYYTLVGDQNNAALTAIELQLEQNDGGAPGNTVFMELADLLATKGDEVADLINIYGNDAIDYLDNVANVNLANLNLEQGYVVSQLSQEFDIPIAITGRWADTPAEAEIRKQAYNKMQELISQGMDGDLARLQIAQEFGINPHQVKISGGGPEIDVFIPKDVWDTLLPEEQDFIRLQLEVFNVDIDSKDDFTIDFYQNITDLKQGWPDPTTNTPAGSIIFNPDGTIIHQPLGNP